MENKEMTQEFKKGQIVRLDADMANSGTVTVVRQTPQRKFTTVSDGSSQWDVMTYRLSVPITSPPNAMEESQAGFYCCGNHLQDGKCCTAPKEELTLSVDAPKYEATPSLSELMESDKMLGEAMGLLKMGIFKDVKDQKSRNELISKYEQLKQNTK